MSPADRLLDAGHAVLIASATDQEIVVPLSVGVVAEAEEEPTCIVVLQEEAQ